MTCDTCIQWYSKGHEVTRRQAASHLLLLRALAYIISFTSVYGTVRRGHGMWFLGKGRVDQHGLDMIPQTVEQSLRMTGEVNYFQHFKWSERSNWTYMLTKDNERHTIGKLKGEVNDRTYGLVHVREADIHHEQTELQVTNNRTGRT